MPVASTQLKQVRCSACRTLFEATIPINVPVEIAIAAIIALRCPSCDAGSDQIDRTQNRTLTEDRSFARGKSLAERIQAWHANGERGLSARAMAAHFTGEPVNVLDLPSDVEDFQRCLLMFDRIPEWKARIPELASLSPHWARLAERWEAIADCLIRECGPDLDHRPSPEADRLLRDALTIPQP